MSGILGIWNLDGRPIEQVVRRRLRSAYPVAVSVSGGLDSSAIFCLAETLRRAEAHRLPPLFGISYASPAGSPSDEGAFVSAIERAYGVKIERVPMSVGLLDGSREMVWHIEAPLLEVTWNGEHLLLDCARERGARVVLTGLWADQMLFGQAYLVDLFRRLAWGEVWAHLREFGRWFPDADRRYFWKRFFLELVSFHVPEMLLPLLRKLRRRARVVLDTPDHPWYTEAFRNRVRQCASKQPPGGPLPPPMPDPSTGKPDRSTMSCAWSGTTRRAPCTAWKWPFPFWTGIYYAS